jgi:hypothetical protein
MQRLISIVFIFVAATTLGAATSHWAFQPLTKPSGDSIDHFIEKKLQLADLASSETVHPRRLVRRLFLDLIGLPPTPKEIAEFSCAKLESTVDRLLARPQYGERWGRHWLDLARYADSNGLHQDTDRPHAWRYRDYVIESFNQDKPYGRFIREQLAGDEIDPDNPEAWIATGFCRNGPSNEENIAKNEVEQYRLDQLDDILSTTAQVFLGQSLACARCHDHKTEPFTAVDYYSLLAVFEPTVPAFVPLTEKKVGEPQFKRPTFRAKYRPPKQPHIRALSEPNEKPPITRVLNRGSHTLPGNIVIPAIPASLSLTSPSFTIKPTGQTTGRRTALANWIAAPDNPLTWRVMANRIWQFHFGRGLVDTPSNFGVTGSKPTHPELLDWLACELRDNGGRLKPIHKLIVVSKIFRQSSAFRADAAKVDPDNHLHWRYQPHRLQAEVIRDSILQASDNLNPKMGGPGIKPRVPAEIIDQSIRNMWPKVGKESSRHWRRSVYIYIKRQLPMPMLELFDAPDTARTCAKRFASTTPTQALALLNDEFVNKQARWLAVRVVAGEKPVERMFEKTWARPVSEERLQQARDFVAERLTVRGRGREARKLAYADLAVVLFNSSQFVYVD